MIQHQAWPLWQAQTSPMHAGMHVIVSGSEATAARIRNMCVLACVKVQNAAMAGARAAVIVNNMEGGHLIAMGDDGRGTQPPIPAVLVDAAAGLQLAAALKVSPLI